MPFVLTVDQIDSQRQDDLVSGAIASLRGVQATLGFTRTAGDEFQGMLDEPLSVVAAILILMRTSAWHIGLGVGPVDGPLPEDTRSGRGLAYVAARAAVDRAKRESSHISVVAVPPAEVEGHDAEVVLRLIAALWDRRSEQGWDAVDLARAGLTMTEAAHRLQITRQAVGQRLQAAQWVAERAAVPVVGRLLQRADQLVAAGATR